MSEDGPGNKFFTLNPRRKTSNLLIQPTLQLTLPVCLLLLTLGFAAVSAMHSHMAYGRLFELALEHTEQREFFEKDLKAQTADFKVVSGALAGAYVLIVMVVSILYAHRLVGPSVAFRRQLEAMKNGDFSQRVKLRKGDAFAEIADDLNELAEIFERDKGEGSSIT